MIKPLIIKLLFLDILSIVKNLASTLSSPVGVENLEPNGASFWIELDKST